MKNEISNTGFWITNNSSEHVFIPELSNEINNFVKKHNIKTVYDFGCGLGDYLYELTKAYPDAVATGFEGHQTDVKFNNVVKQDLSKNIELPIVDLVISIEVGEHIPKEFEQIFIDNITKHSNKHIILSWAIKKQSGLGHINCQDNDYIIEQIEKRGWKFDSSGSHSMRKAMPNIWIKNTLMVFVKQK
jgi:hypothetical protein